MLEAQRICCSAIAITTKGNLRAVKSRLKDVTYFRQK